ncbi:MAG TPA: hypothetical protein VL983_00050 [Terriglobales bacterium]|nr:hypothetical protein [Terriglobales bacterium]
MKRAGLYLLLAMTLILSGTALAQGDNSVYFVTYYSNAHTSGAPDATVRAINDGDTGANLWASFYVFDDSQEMNECCSCQITPDGILSEDVNLNLTANTLTGRVPKRGTIKVISSSVQAFGPAGFANFETHSDFTNVPTPGLRIWATHVQSGTPTGGGGFSTTESLVADSNLVSSEESLLETLCFYIAWLGSDNYGICSCTPEDQDF